MMSTEADFKINSCQLSAEAVSSLKSFVDEIKGNEADTIKSVSIVGWASPDGIKSLNQRLSHNRASEVAEYFSSYLNLPAEAVSFEGKGENWTKFRELIDGGDNIPYKSRVMDIITSDADDEEKELQLRNLDSGKVWRYLTANIFPKLRCCEISIDYTSGLIVKATLSDSELSSDISASSGPESEDDKPEVMTEIVEDNSFSDNNESSALNAYVKTNLPAWALLWTNLAGEVDFAHHWSANLSLYYSGFNYFDHTRKFRTFTIMPEVRYWIRPENQGFFIAPHVGLSWFNCAFGGDYRYQDHNGNTPAIGGGLNLGYRLNLSRNKRWLIEASIGCGVYRLDYDIFVNDYNGLLTGRRKRTFFGIDNAAISLCYRFDLDRKKQKNGIYSNL